MKEEPAEGYHFEDPGQGPFAVSRCGLLSFGRLGLLVTLEDNSKIMSFSNFKYGPSSILSELWMTQKSPSRVKWFFLLMVQQKTSREDADFW